LAQQRCQLATVIWRAVRLAAAASIAWIDLLLVQDFVFPPANYAHLDASEILSLQTQVYVIGHRDRGKPGVKVEILLPNPASRHRRSPFERAK
jgi:hypothetical protein